MTGPAGTRTALTPGQRWHEYRDRYPELHPDEVLVQLLQEGVNYTPASLGRFTKALLTARSSDIGPHPEETPQCDPTDSSP